MFQKHCQLRLAKRLILRLSGPAFRAFVKDLLVEEVGVRLSGGVRYGWLPTRRWPVLEIFPVRHGFCGSLEPADNPWLLICLQVDSRAPFVLASCQALPLPSSGADVRLVPNKTKLGLVVDRAGSSHFRFTLGNGLLHFRRALRSPRANIPASSVAVKGCWFR
jgi:hypothetical protein